jgi:flagellar basal-body rod protein FlgF
MGDLIGSAARILAQSQWRLEVSAQNMSNATTPGYKRRIAFATLEQGGLDNNQSSANNTFSRDAAPGKLIETGSVTDLAILGQGYFTVGGDAGVFYTRQGQFTRESDGRLTGPGGLALQFEGGGDVVLDSAAFAVTADGMVTQAGEPVGRLALVSIPASQLRDGPAGGLFSASEVEDEPLAERSVRQGALEASNVTTGDEMVVMMEALRRAESAQRIVNVYDDLLGRAITSFGQA